MQLAQVMERVWHRLNKPSTLLALVIFLLLLLILTFLLPQTPVSPANEAAFLRWLGEVRTSLGASTSLFASLGLLSLRTSWWTRGALALLTLVLAARCARLGERWNDLTPGDRALRLSPLLGGLLLLIGWGVQLHYSWIESGVSVWPRETITLPAHDLTLTAPADAKWFTPRTLSLYLVRESHGLGLDITASEEDGDPIPLLPSAQGEPRERLRLILTPQSPDVYFALPSSRFIFRLTLLAPSPEPQFRVQIYRGSGGELLSETVLQDEEQLFVEDLQLHFKNTRLSQLRVIYNPGAPLMGVGGSLLLVGALVELCRDMSQAKARFREAAPGEAATTMEERS